MSTKSRQAGFCFLDKFALESYFANVALVWNCLFNATPLKPVRKFVLDHAFRDIIMSTHTFCSRFASKVLLLT